METMKETELRLSVNGAERSVTCEPDAPLLDVLRHDLGLAGPKFGCGMGLCGACFVLIGDRVRSSCDLPVSALDGRAWTPGAGSPPGGRTCGATASWAGPPWAGTRACSP
jgi:2Fe-2S iron-sulfur cluster binding domain